MIVPKVTSISLAVAAALAAAACVSTTERKEDMLAAAGFQIKVADTPEKLAALKQLPPHRFAISSQAGQPSYLYADPTICRCLYYGGPAAYQAYQQMAFTQRIADQRQMTAMMLQDASWDWGVWGPWGPY